MTFRINDIIWLEMVVEKLAWKHRVLPHEVEAVLKSSPKVRLIEDGDH